MLPNKLGWKNRILSLLKGDEQSTIFNGPVNSVPPRFIATFSATCQLSPPASGGEIYSPIVLRQSQGSVSHKKMAPKLGAKNILCHAELDSASISTTDPGSSPG